MVIMACCASVVLMLWWCWLFFTGYWALSGRASCAVGVPPARRPTLSRMDRLWIEMDGLANREISAGYHPDGGKSFLAAALRQPPGS